MSAMADVLRTAALRLIAAPSAVFLAVLTAGLAASSTARHSGIFATSAVNGTRPSVVLACPRTRALKPKNASSASAASSTAACRRSAGQASAVEAAEGSERVEWADESARADKREDGKSAASAGVSIPLPDFSTPDLSRFTSPL
jgi:deoxyxylulose-5-phosphate synthase